MKQNVYQISCICQHIWLKDNEILIFQRISAKHFNIKNQIKSAFVKICNTYCIIQCKIQMICYINSQKLIIGQSLKQFVKTPYDRKLNYVQ